MNKLKGDQYEIFIRDYIINELSKPAYLWKDIPEAILIKAGLIHSSNQHQTFRALGYDNPLVDVGVDILQYDKDTDNYTLVQCKNGYNKGLTIKDLAGFYMMTTNHRKLLGSVYYTSKLSTHITNNKIDSSIQYVKKVMPYPTNQNVTIFKPYNYQIEASNKIVVYLQNNNKAILNFPCGCGKTYTSYMTSTSFKTIVFLSPLRQFAKQNIDRFIEYGYNKNTALLVDSDGTRNTEDIVDFIKLHNGHVLLSATFNSVDKIYEIIDKLDNPLVIIDEFHNLTKRNVTDNNDDFYKLLASDHKFLLMSATPRIYELEDDMEDGIDIGEIVYSISFTEAIEKKYITDYRIYLPSVSEINDELEKILQDEILSIDELDQNIKSKCMFLFKCLLHNGSKKCIVYCSDINEIDEMMDTMCVLNQYYLLDINMQRITSEVTPTKRQKILDNFSEIGEIELLFSVRIMDECIDIPSCDSIFITHPSNNKIRTIQRMCRCIRTDKKNPFKVGNVYVWCSKYDDILDTLSGIKEYDIMLKDKVSVLETNWIGKKEANKLVVADKQLVENYVIGIKEFRFTSWEDKLSMVKKYIDEHGKRPSKKSTEIKVKQIGMWLCRQFNNRSKQIEAFGRDDIVKKWDEFIKYYNKIFKSNEAIWYERLNAVKSYIDVNNRLPPYASTPELKKLSKWIYVQARNYKTCSEIMRFEHIRNSWLDFTTKYNQYFKTADEIWTDKLNNVKEFIDTNKKRPSDKSNDNVTKILGKWLCHQLINYNSNSQILKNQHIRLIFEDFLNEYKAYLRSDNEIWMDKLNDVKEYIDVNKKRPSTYNNDMKIKQLGKWLSKYIYNYRYNKEIMKVPEMRQTFSEFLEEYKEYL